MEEKILNLIAQKNGKINFRQLKNILNIDSKTLENLILELKIAGKILQQGNKYFLFPEGMLIGDVSITSNGTIFVYHDEKKIPVANNSFKSVLLNDIVAFRINDNGEAKIESVIDRRIKNITCEVVIEDGVKKVIPYHKEIKVSLDKDSMKELLDGDIILVDLDVNNEDEYCNAKLVKKLAIKNSPNRREIETAINYGFDNDYSDEYLEELSKLPKDTSNEDLSKRTDFRNLKTFTIDGIYTKDMDDACSGERLPNGDILVYVHISDVSHYVKRKSKLFERACEKTTSLYTNNSVFHMFHHILSNGICSLNQGEDRLTKTVIMKVDQEGHIYDTEIVKSVINSNKKMTYEDVDEVLKGNVVEGYQDYVEELQLLNEAAIRIRKRMEKDGLISFANTELEKEYDDDGKLISYHYAGESQARKLIEFLMVAANSVVAEFLFYSPLPSVFRVHEFPELRKINTAINKINDLGNRIKLLKGIDGPLALQKVQKAIQNEEDYQILSTILLQCMKLAKYSTKNLGHFALALYFYTHFTSPIRRLPDLLVHMLLDILLEQPELIESINLDEMEQELERLCIKSNIMRKQADMAEKKAEKDSIIENMADHIGEEFEGVVLELGKQIKIRINSVDVTIKPEDFGDNFKFVKKKKLFYDSTTGLYLKTGMKVNIFLKGVDLPNKNLFIKVLNIVNQKTSNKVKKKIK